jgi:tetratricopeptide (TPR) repeat protein
MVDRAASGRPQRGRVADDPVARLLAFGIFAVIIVSLTGFIYAMFTGVIFPQAPRTRLESQVRDYESLVKGKPKDPKLWSQYAIALALAKQPVKAEQVIKRGNAAVATQTAQLALAQGYYYNSIGNEKAAVEWIDKAITIDRRLRTIKARELAGKKIAFDPKNVPWDNSVFYDARMFKAKLALNKGDYKAAIKEYDLMLILDDTASDVLTARGDAFLSMGEKAKARADYKRALMFIPDYAPALAGMEKVGAK